MKLSFRTIITCGVAFLLAACGEFGKTDKKSTVAEKDTVKVFNVKGIVSDENGTPLANVKVTSTDTTIYTDSCGAFSLPAPIADERVTVKIDKEGYFYHICSQSIKDTLTNQIILVKKATSDYSYVGEFESSKGVSLTVDGGKVDIPANAISKADGSPFSGKVKIASCYLNTDNNKFMSLMPGGDLCAINLKNENVHLISYGMFRVELEDEQGRKLQLKKGYSAKLRFPITAIHKNVKSDTIPLWYFDETIGLWKEEGLSLKKNGYFEGEVKHFTWWNCDKVFTNPGKLKVVYTDAYGREILSYYNVNLASGDGFGPLRSNLYFSNVPSNEDLNILCSIDGSMYLQKAVKAGESKELRLQLDGAYINVTIKDSKGAIINKAMGETFNIPQLFDTRNGQFKLWLKKNSKENVKLDGSKKTYVINWNDVKDCSYTLVVKEEEGKQVEKALTDFVESNKENLVIDALPENGQPQNKTAVSGNEELSYNVEGSGFIFNIKYSSSGNGSRGVGIGCLKVGKFNYPEDAKEKGIEGDIYIEVTINPDNSVENIHVVKGLYPSLDAEALRMVRTLRGWRPRWEGGMPVTTKVKIPLKVRLN